VRAGSRPDPNDGVLARYDVSAARDALGWSATTTLRDGIRRLLTA
jgi:nucleoside-diphosphate-sugar epimerase